MEGCMIEKPKMNKDVYITLCSGYSVNIVKGKVVGCYKPEYEYGRLIYIIETCLGRYDRRDSDLYSSPKDIADHIEDFVIEEAKKDEA